MLKHTIVVINQYVGGWNRTQTNLYTINPNVTYKFTTLISLRYPHPYPRNLWLLLDLIGSYF